MALMAPIARSPVVATIVNRIRELLVQGDLKPGQRLPSEQEMAVQLSVGRGSVREATKMLAALGVVEIRQGDGTYVASAATPALVDPLMFAILVQSGTSAELLELRALIEVGYCELAAEKATEEDFARLEASLALWKEAATQSAGVQRLAELDLKFHHDVIDLARNPLVARIAHTVEDLFVASVKRSIQSVGGFERAFEAHARVLAALRSRDPVQIRRVVRQSLEYWHTIAEQNRKEQTQQEG